MIPDLIESIPSWPGALREFARYLACVWLHPGRKKIWTGAVRTRKCQVCGREWEPQDWA